MNLVVDIGNNYFKLGIFENSNLIYTFSDKNSEINNEIEIVLTKYKNVSYAIISNVSSLSVFEVFKKFEIKVLKLDSTLALPFILNYKTPETLGK